MHYKNVTFDSLYQIFNFFLGESLISIWKTIFKLLETDNFVSFSIIFLSLCTFGQNTVKPWPVNSSQGKKRRKKIHFLFHRFKLRKK
jgi:hypothetical protein